MQLTDAQNFESVAIMLKEGVGFRQAASIFHSKYPNITKPHSSAIRQWQINLEKWGTVSLGQPLVKKRRQTTPDNIKKMAELLRINGPTPLRILSKQIGIPYTSTQKRMELLQLGDEYSLQPGTCVEMKQTANKEHDLSLNGHPLSQPGPSSIKSSESSHREAEQLNRRLTSLGKSLVSERSSCDEAEVRDTCSIKIDELINSDNISVSLVKSRIGEPISHFERPTSASCITDIVHLYNSSALQTDLSSSHTNLTGRELKQFIGIALLMSCVYLPQTDAYCSDSFRHGLLCNVMTRQRFDVVKRRLEAAGQSERVRELESVVAQKAWMLYLSQADIDKVPEQHRLSLHDLKLVVSEEFLQLDLIRENSLTPVTIKTEPSFNGFVKVEEPSHSDNSS